MQESRNKKVYYSKLFVIYRSIEQLIKFLLTPKLKVTILKFLSKSDSKNVYVHFLCMISACFDNGHHRYRTCKKRKSNVTKLVTTKL